MTKHLIRTGLGGTACCGANPFDLPRGDRLTLDPAAATCLSGHFLVSTGPLCGAPGAQREDQPPVSCPACLSLLREVVRDPVRIGRGDPGARPGRLKP